MKDAIDQTARMRALRFLCREKAEILESADAATLILQTADGSRIGVSRAVMKDLDDGGLTTTADGWVTLTPAGRTIGTDRRDLLAAVPQSPEAAMVETADGPAAVMLNAAESPLAALWRRRTRDGARYLSDAEFRAGERLRADYGRGQIIPRMGVNWSAVGGAAGSGGRRDGIAELTTAALDARSRVERAVEAVGPELSGILIDVCCFLKGLEQVEAERSWPARSAKVVLKSALAALAWHYQPPRSRSNGAAMLHWGTADYRPAISGPGT